MTLLATDPLAERHFTCLTCRYDLYGIPDDRLCPECGRPAAESRRAQAHFFDPIALATCRRGLVLLIWTTGLSLLSIGICFTWGVMVSGEKHFEMLLIAAML